MDKHSKFLHTVCTVLALASGCAPPSDASPAMGDFPVDELAGELPYDDESLELAQVTAALVEGAWAPAGTPGPVTSERGENGYLPVCRVAFDAGQHPGKLWQGDCLFEWGGTELRSREYETLQNAGYQWVTIMEPFEVFGQPAGYRPVLPPNAVDGGSSGQAGGFDRLAVCEALYKGSWHPGKYWRDRCNIGYAGDGVSVEPLISSWSGEHSVKVLVR